MKHSDISLKTKKTLACSLRKLMEHKPLSRITISELCSDCGFNRKTFYYHFDDIHGLLKWMLEQEAGEALKKCDIQSDYKMLLTFVIDYVDENNHILNSMYDTMSKENMADFFFSDCKKIIGVMIDHLAEKAGCVIDDKFREFLCSFYATSLSGLLIDWFRSRSSYSKEEIMDYITFTLRSSLPAILKARSAASDPHPGL